MINVVTMLSDKCCCKNDVVQSSMSDQCYYTINDDVRSMLKINEVRPVLQAERSFCKTNDL